MLESSILEFLEKIFTVLHGHMHKTTPNSLKKGGRATLHLLRTLLEIHQKLRESSFWKAIVSLVLLA